MTEPRRSSHLVERAIAAMGELGGISAPPRRVLPELPATTPRPVGDALWIQPEVPEIPPVPSHTSPAKPGLPHPTLGLALLQRAGLSALPGQRRSRAEEEITIIQHQLLRTLPAAEGHDRGSRIVLVTSALPREGKTFCALNIAASLAAKGGSPVVLVDADGQERSLSQLLGLESAPGLLQAMAAGGGQFSAAAWLQDTAVPRLMILPFGVPGPQGAAAPTLTALATAVQRLAAALPGQVLVLDARPCLASSDPAVLAPVADMVLVVVEAERTVRNEVEAALDMVEACGNLKLVLNKARLGGSGTFGAHA